MGNETVGPSLGQLEAFCAVARSQSYAEAARATAHRSTPYRMVRRLETEVLGVTLFSRGKITREGARLLPFAQDVLGAMSLFLREADALGEEHRDVLRLSSYPAHVARFIARAVRRLHDELPDVEVEFVEIDDRRRRAEGSGLFAELRTGELDLVIAPPRESPVRTYQERPAIFAWHLVAVSAPRRSRQSPERSIRDLAHKPLGTSPVGHRSRALLQEAFDAAGMYPRIELATDSTEALLGAAAEGLVTAVLPDDALDDSFLRQRSRLQVSRLTFNETQIGGTYSLYMRRPPNRGTSVSSPSRGNLLKLALLIEEEAKRAQERRLTSSLSGAKK